jgi:hypothetical protein
LIVGKVSVSLERSLKETALKDGSLTERQSLFCGIFLSFIPISEKGHRLFQVHFRKGPYTRFQAVMGKSHGKGAITKNGSGTMLSPRIEI